MLERYRRNPSSTTLPLVALAVFVLVGCGDEPDTSDADCNIDTDCPDDAYCVDGACQKPVAGAPCPDELEGESHNDLVCRDGIWQVDDPAPTALVVTTQPPPEVSTGASFSVAFGVVDEGGDRLETDGIEITTALDDGDFTDGSTASTATTAASGIATFDLAIADAGTDYVLTATSNHGDLDGVSAVTDPFDVVGGADAATSAISGESGVVADGEQPAEITIELLDDDANPVVGTTPEFQATGGGNEYEECGETDSQGIATCAMTSTEAGPKQLEITSPVTATGETIEFFALPCELDASPFGGGTGSSDQPYAICSPDQLNRIGDGDDYRDDSFALARSIDMADVGAFNIIGDVEFPDVTDGEFSGRFDGNGLAISNLTVDRDSEDLIGLFGFIGDSGEVFDLVVEDLDVTGAQRVGGLAGGSNGSIWDVATGGTIRGDSGVGGLVGVSLGADNCNISNSQSNADVEAPEDYAGGLVGRMSPCTVTDSHATGDVVGGNSYVGGLIGESSDGSVHDSYATGDVTGEDHFVGGLVGRNWGGTIRDSYATGDVGGEANMVGGLVGQSWYGAFPDGIVSGCFATGDLSTSGDEVGGLVGNQNNGELENSYATGSVSGGDEVGGLVGFVDDVEIRHAYATGAISGDGDDLGAVVGNHWGVTVINVFWDLETSGLDDDEGGSGSPMETAVFDEEDNFYGWDFDDIWEIGEAPDGETRPILKWQNE